MTRPQPSGLHWQHEATHVLLVHHASSGNDHIRAILRPSRAAFGWHVHIGPAGARTYLGFYYSLAQAKEATIRALHAPMEETHEDP